MNISIKQFPSSYQTPAPPWTRIGRLIESMTRKAIFEYELIEGASDTIGVALSGGKDSITLLYMLHAILGKGLKNHKIIAFHVSGEFSCGASVQLPFLKSVCAQLDIELIVLESKKTRESLECYSCSRERRSLIFGAAKQRGISHIAFGHHREDAIQTLLMNLLHKGEFAGTLAKVPMQEYGVTIIRPLHLIPEETIIEFAKLYGFHRITCQCPVGQNSLRMDTKELLFELERVFPNARVNLARALMKYGSTKALTP